MARGIVPRVSALKWWLRVVGVFYLFQFVANAILRLPIAALGPADALEMAAAGNPLANFLVDTWVIYGLEVGAIGLGLLVASRAPERANPLVWTVIAVEALRGIVADCYVIARGLDPTVSVVWIFIHAVVIVTAVLALRATSSVAALSSRAR